MTLAVLFRGSLQKGFDLWFPVLKTKGTLSSMKLTWRWADLRLSLSLLWIQDQSWWSCWFSSHRTSERPLPVLSHAHCLLSPHPPHPVLKRLAPQAALKLFVTQIHCKCLSHSKEAEKATTDMTTNQPNANQRGKTAEIFEGLGLTQTGFTVCVPSCSLMPQTSWF